MIEVQGLVKTFGSLRAVDGLSFSVTQGNIVGFLGPNGAGKTTTMKILTGFLAPTAGSVKIAGLDVLADSLAVRRKLGYLPENAPSYPDMTVLEFLLFIAGVRHLTGAQRRERLDALLTLTELADRRHQLIHSLSRGFKQRLGLAQALLHDPELLILDEPTSGLDPNQIVEIRNLIQALGKTKTVLLSTHQLAEVEAVCNRVLIIHQGKLAMDGSIEDVLRQAAGVKALVVSGHGAPLAVVREILKSRLQALKTLEVIEDRGETWKLRLIGNTESLQKEVFQIAVERGWTLSEISVSEARLEQVFRQLTAAPGTAAAREGIGAEAAAPAAPSNRPGGAP